MADEQVLVVRNEAWKSVAREWEAQDAKWGEQNHSLLWWLLILQEVIGEEAKAMLEGRGDSQVRKELVQVTAVCVAALESFDRVGLLGGQYDDAGRD